MPSALHRVADDADQAPAAYWHRRDDIAGLASCESPVDIEYTDVEHA